MASNAVSRFYAKHHADNAKVGTERIASPQRIDLLCQWIGSDRDLLDLGCRDGALTSSFLAGNRVTGIDIDEQALAIAASRGLKTICSDLNEPLPVPDASFDVVVMGETLEHLMFPPVAVAEVARVLKPTGTFVGSVPNGYRLKSRRIFLFGGDIDTNPFREHLHIFARWTLKKMLKEYFDEVEIHAVGGRIFGPIHVGPGTPAMLAFWFGKDLVFRATRVKPLK